MKTSQKKITASLSRIRLFGGCLLTLAAVGLLGSSLRGFEDAKDSGPGLRGILPAEVPGELDAEAFAVLDENWAEWSKETAEKVAALYADESLGADGQRKLLDELNDKLETMADSLADDRYRSIFTPLIHLHGKLARRVAVAESALATLELDPEAVRKNRLAKAQRGVLEAIENLEQLLGMFENSSGWAQYVRTDELKGMMTSGVSADPLFGSVREKISGRESLEDETQKNFLGHSQFIELEESLAALSAADEASSKAVDQKKLRAGLGELFQALSDYEETNSIEAGGRIHKALKSVSAESLDNGDQIEDALRKHYFSHNLRVVASESFLNQLFEEKRTDKGPVVDRILGADVRGTQTTTTTAGIDLKPFNKGVRFDVTLDGEVRSSTSGTTDQATIYTDGYHTFTARKEILFNGETFTTRPARISVNANNNTVGASTGLNGTPIFGGIAKNVAMREARKRRSQSEAIARGRISDRVTPEFNHEVDKEFAKSNEDLKSGFTTRLKDNGLFPELREFSTTDTEFRLNTRTMVSEELGGSALSFRVKPGQGVAISLHESVFNNGLDKLALAGQTMTETELVGEIEKSFTKLLGKDFEFSSTDETKSEKSPDTFVFDANDPIRIQIEDGAVNLVLRAGLKQEGKKEIPAQHVTIPLNLRIEENQLVIERGTVRVAPVAAPKTRFLQIARAGVIRNKVESSVKDRKRDRKVSMPRKGKDDLILTMTKIQALDGWLTVWAE